MTTVLVVDDDVGFAEGLAACLRSRNYRTYVESNGDAALAMMGGRPVDVALCDIVMPGLLGPGFMQKAQSVPGQEMLPVIFMSTLPEERVRRMFDGYAAYLRKPFTIPDAIATIETVVGRPRRGQPAVPPEGRSPAPSLPPLHTPARTRR
ncbi:MAG: response regulator [Pseudomonadota bacterium]|nr:response regulator [Pseudomonadota bacterium]